MNKNLILITSILVILRSCHVYCKYEDQKRNVPQIIESRGFKCEKHYVTTVDGYVLEMHRIINPDSKTEPKLRRPLLLQHGLFCSSAVFVLNSAGLGTENSDTYFDGQVVSNTLAFALAMFDYDVWMPNSRGNQYSMNHTTLNTNSYKFWQFSFDQMIEFDLPASIDYILRHTGYKSLGYIGHSQGTTTMFGLLASKPEYSKILKPAIALAPVAKVGNVKTPVRYLANSFTTSFFYWKGGQFLKYSTAVITTIGQITCRVYEIATTICANAYFLFSGGLDSKEMDMERVAVYVAHLPAPTSSWNVVHFAQMISSNRFCKFDHGKFGNIKKYGSMSPPEYNLRNIDSPYIALLSSENDWLGTPKDTDFIRRQLSGKLMIDYVVPDKEWNHIDFILGKHAAKYVNVVVLDILKKFDLNKFRAINNDVNEDDYYYNYNDYYKY